MNIIEKLESDAIAALKEGQKEKLETLRLIKAALKNEKIAKGADLGEEDVMAVLRRQMKQLKEAREEFVKGGRADLVEKADKEMRVIEEYLPQELEEEEIIKVIEQKIEESGEANLGKLMGLVMKELKGRANGEKVRELVEKIAGGKG